MAALVQGYPQQSGTVTVLQARPSSASGMLQSLPVQSATPYVPGGSHRNSVHGLPSTVTAPVVYRGGSGAVQQYALRSMPSLNPAAPWQQSRAQRTSSSPAVPTIQTLDYLQPAASRSRYSASVSMTNLPSTANQGLQTTIATRDDLGLPVPGARRAATAPRPSQTNNGASLAPAAPIRAAPERYRRSAALRADSTGAATGAQLRPSHSAMLNRPNSFVGSMPESAVDDTVFSQNQPHGEIKRVRRRSMPALDSPGFPIHLTPHDLKQPAESNRPKTADLEGKAGKTGNNQTTDKTSNDGQAGSSRSAGANVNPSSVSPLVPKIPHFLPRARNQPTPRIVQSYVMSCLLRFKTNTSSLFHPSSPPTATALTPLATPPCRLPWTRLVPTKILLAPSTSPRGVRRPMPRTPNAPQPRRRFQNP
jgi:hypothetical protein